MSPVQNLLQNFCAQSLLHCRRHKIAQRPAMLGDFAHQLRAQVAVRLARKHEHCLEPRPEPVVMQPGEPYSYLSSKLVREIAQHGGPLSDLVPPTVELRLRAKVL